MSPRAKHRVSIHFGALASPLYEQLGVAKPERYSTAWQWERDFEAINRLCARGLLTEWERDRVRRRFLRRIKRDSEK